jgi:hypothetical protein
MLSSTNFLLVVIYSPSCPVKPQPSKAALQLFDTHAIVETVAQFPLAIVTHMPGAPLPKPMAPSVPMPIAPVPLPLVLDHLSAALVHIPLAPVPMPVPKARHQSLCKQLWCLYACCASLHVSSTSPFASSPGAHAIGTSPYASIASTQANDTSPYGAQAIITSPYLGSPFASSSSAQAISTSLQANITPFLRK